MSYTSIISTQKFSEQPFIFFSFCIDCLNFRRLVDNKHNGSEALPTNSSNYYEACLWISNLYLRKMYDSVFGNLLYNRYQKSGNLVRRMGTSLCGKHQAFPKYLSSPFFDYDEPYFVFSENVIFCKFSPNFYADYSFVSGTAHLADEPLKKVS